MSVKLEQVGGDLEIDVDIEKKITQLQEAKLAGEIERPEQLSIDPEKQLTERPKNFSCKCRVRERRFR